MKESKLIKILKTLDKEEFKRLGWFVKSNYYNTDENLVRLFAFLKKHYPGFSSKNFGKETLFEHVFQGTDYSDAKVRNLTSKMNLLLEKYLINLEWEKGNALKEQLLIRAYEKRNIDHDEYQKKNLSLGKTLENNKLKTIEDSCQLFFLNSNYYFNPNTEKTGDAIYSLKKAAENLEVFYQTSKLKLLCELNARQGVFNEKANPKNASENLLLEIYSHIYEMQKNATYKKYETAKKIFSTYFNDIEKKEQRGIFQLLLNFAIGQHNKGIDKYGEESFELYKFGLSTEILLDQSKISDATFINISTLGSAFMQFAWTKKFINEYEKKLASSFKNETVAIGWGYWHFFKKDFSGTIEKLQEIIFRHFDYKVHSRWLLVRSFYELYSVDYSYLHLTEFSILSFEKFLRRNKKISPIRQNILLSTLSELKTIVKATHKKQLNRIEKKHWIDSINTKKQIMGKKWIIEKIENL